MRRYTTSKTTAMLSLMLLFLGSGCEPRGGGNNAENNASTTPGEPTVTSKPGRVLFAPEGIVSEDGTLETFELTLSRMPDAPVTIYPFSFDTSEGRVEPEVLVFDASNWEVPQEVRVYGVDDLVADRDQEYPVYFGVTSQDAGFKNPRPIRMTTTDNDEAIYWVEVIQNTAREDGTQQAQLRVRIATPPIQRIEFTFEPSVLGEISAIPNVAFHPGDPLVKDVWIDAIDDLEADGDQTFDLDIKPAMGSDKSYLILDPTNVELVTIDGTCGNAVLEAAEGCDDGNTTTEVCDYGLSCCIVCNSSCQEAAGELTGFCGDEMVQPSFEVCDGNLPNACGAVMRTSGAVLCEDSCQTVDTTGCHRFKSTAVAIGTDHACALTTDDPINTQGIECWGDNTRFAASPPMTVDGPAHVAAGDGFTCVGQGDSVICWGDNAPTSYNTNGDVISLSANGRRVCSIDGSGAIRCEGTAFNPLGPAPPANDPLREVHVGTAHTCWLSAAGAVACWVHTDAGSITPPDGIVLEKLSVGGFAACGLDNTGAIHCWGRQELTTAPSGTGFMDVSVGHNAACAIRDDLTVACWGDALIVDETPGPDFLASTIEVGAHAPCALFADSDIRCWGRGIRDRIADPSSNHSIEELATGSTHICASSQGKTTCWGDSFEGGTEVPHTLPASQLAAGDDFTCFKDLDRDDFRCVGRSSTVDNMPFANSNSVMIARDSTLCSIQPQSGYTCQGNDTFASSSTNSLFALTPDGSVCARGADGNIEAPCNVTSAGLPSIEVCEENPMTGEDELRTLGFWDLVDLQSLSIQEDMVCGRFNVGAGCQASTNKLACCCPGGTNGCCQETATEQIAIHNKFCSPARADSSVLCFSPSLGGGVIRIGPDSTADMQSMAPIRPETLVSGRSHSCALTYNEQIFCWGDDTYGQSSPPLEAPTRFEKLFAEEDYTCAIDIFDRYMCWGSFVMPLR